MLAIWEDLFSVALQSEDLEELKDEDQHLWYFTSAIRGGYETINASFCLT